MACGCSLLYFGFLCDERVRAPVIRAVRTGYAVECYIRAGFQTGISVKRKERGRRIQIGYFAVLVGATVHVFASVLSYCFPQSHISELRAIEDMRFAVIGYAYLLIIQVRALAVRKRFERARSVVVHYVGSRGQ